MPISFIIRGQADAVRVQRNLNKLAIEIPNWTSQSMYKWGKILEKDMVNSARKAEIGSFSGNLYGGRSIEYRQRPRGKIGKLFISQYLIYLDSMRDHWVNVNRSRTTLLTWASKSIYFRKKASAVRRGKLKKFGIFVTRHPFIQTGYRRALPKLTPYLREGLRRGFKSIR